MTLRFLVIGPYASGRTQALKAFRDLGFVTMGGAESFTQALALLDTLTEQSATAEGVAVSVSLLPNLSTDRAIEDLAQLKERLGALRPLLTLPMGDVGFEIGVMLSQVLPKAVCQGNRTVLTSSTADGNG